MDITSPSAPYRDVVSLGLLCGYGSSDLEPFRPLIYLRFLGIIPNDLPQSALPEFIRCLRSSYRSVVTTAVDLPSVPSSDAIMVPSVEMGAETPASLTQRLRVPNHVSVQIEKDIIRLLPDDPIFRIQALSAAIHRILLVYVFRCPEPFGLGYRQGMHDIAAYCMLTYLIAAVSSLSQPLFAIPGLEWDIEADTYVLFTAIMAEIAPVFEIGGSLEVASIPPGSGGAIGHAQQLQEAFLAIFDPDLADILKSARINLYTLVFRSHRALFTREVSDILPIREIRASIIRLWDGLMALAAYLQSNSSMCDTLPYTGSAVGSLLDACDWAELALVLGRHTLFLNSDDTLLMQLVYVDGAISSYNTAQLVIRAAAHLIEWLSLQQIRDTVAPFDWSNPHIALARKQAQEDTARFSASDSYRDLLEMTPNMAYSPNVRLRYRRRNRSATQEINMLQIEANTIDLSQLAELLEFHPVDLPPPKLWADLVALAEVEPCLLNSLTPTPGSTTPVQATRPSLSSERMPQIVPQSRPQTEEGFEGRRTPVPRKKRASEKDIDMATSQLAQTENEVWQLSAALQFIRLEINDVLNSMVPLCFNTDKEVRPPESSHGEATSAVHSTNYSLESAQQLESVVRSLQIGAAICSSCSDDILPATGRTFCATAKFIGGEELADEEVEFNIANRVEEMRNAISELEVNLRKAKLERFQLHGDV